MQSSKEYLGSRIKELRVKAKLTQAQLAENVGIDPKHLSRIEGGKNYPSLDTLEKLAYSLNIQIGDLFEVSHLQDKESLINEISNILKDSDIKDVKIVYRLTKDIIK